MGLEFLRLWGLGPRLKLIGRITRHDNLVTKTIPMDLFENKPIGINAPKMESNPRY